MALDTTKLHNALLSLYRLNHTIVGRGISGQGGAAAHGKSMRYKDAIDSGLSPQLAKQYSDLNMLGGKISGEGEPSLQQLMSWAKTSADPRVKSVLQSAQSQVPGKYSSKAKGSGPYSILDNFIKSFQEQVDKANAANQARADKGEQMLADRTAGAVGRLEGLHSRTMEGLKGYGEGEKALLAEKFREALGNQMANLSARGLGGTTIGSAFAARNARDQAIAESLLNDRINDRTIQYDTSISQDLAKTEAALRGDEVSFLERQVDQGPDPSMLVNLANALGKSGYGSPGVPSPGYGGYGGAAPVGVAPGFVNPAALGYRMPIAGPIGNPVYNLRDRPRAPSQAQINTANQAGMGAAGAAMAATGGLGGLAGALAGMAAQGAINQPQKPTNQPPASRPRNAFGPNDVPVPQAAPQATGKPYSIYDEKFPLPAFAQPVQAPPQPAPQSSAVDPVSSRYLNYHNQLTGPTNTAQQARATANQVGAGLNDLYAQQQNYINRGMQNPAFSLMDTAPVSAIMNSETVKQLQKQFGPAWRQVVASMPQMPQWQGWDNVVPYWAKTPTTKAAAKSHAMAAKANYNSAAAKLGALKNQIGGTMDMPELQGPQSWWPYWLKPERVFSEEFRRSPAYKSHAKAFKATFGS